MAIETSSARDQAATSTNTDFTGLIYVFEGPKLKEVKALANTALDPSTAVVFSALSGGFDYNFVAVLVDTKCHAFKDDTVFLTGSGYDDNYCYSMPSDPFHWKTYPEFSAITTQTTLEGTVSDRTHEYTTTGFADMSSPSASTAWIKIQWERPTVNRIIPSSYKVHYLVSSAGNADTELAASSTVLELTEATHPEEWAREGKYMYATITGLTSNKLYNFVVAPTYKSEDGSTTLEPLNTAVDDDAT